MGLVEMRRNHVVAKILVRGNDIKIENMKFESVEKYKHLGSVITSNNSISEEIRERLAAGGRCYFALKTVLRPNSFTEILS